MEEKGEARSANDQKPNTNPPPNIVPGNGRAREVATEVRRGGTTDYTEGAAHGGVAAWAWIFRWLCYGRVTRQVNRNRRLDVGAYGSSLRRGFETFIRSRTE
jgi:hypothetical protein